jgi:hypothetical protein
MYHGTQRASTPCQVWAASHSLTHGHIFPLASPRCYPALCHPAEHRAKAEAAQCCLVRFEDYTSAGERSALLAPENSGCSADRNGDFAAARVRGGVMDGKDSASGSQDGESAVNGQGGGEVTGRVSCGLRGLVRPARCAQEELGDADVRLELLLLLASHGEGTTAGPGAGVQAGGASGVLQGHVRSPMGKDDGSKHLGRQVTRELSLRTSVSIVSVACLDVRETCGGWCPMCDSLSHATMAAASI